MQHVQKPDKQPYDRRGQQMSEIGPTGSTNSPQAVVYDFTRERRRIEAERSAPADRTGFTDEARELARARQAVDETSDVRAERVAALKKQIESGQYNPDPHEVAKKILERGL